MLRTSELHLVPSSSSKKYTKMGIEAGYGRAYDMFVGKLVRRRQFKWTDLMQDITDVHYRYLKCLPEEGFIHRSLFLEFATVLLTVNPDLMTALDVTCQDICRR